MNGIKNVVLFVSDSLRYDFLPEWIRDQGVCFKTVAQSTHSPPSFATLSTGRYPPEHGVHKFGQDLAEGVETTYNMSDFDGLYFHEGRFTDDPFFRIYDIDQPRHISELGEPFWYLERDTTTHAPYIRNGFIKGYTAESYFKENQSWDKLAKDYRKTIRESFNILERRMDILEKLGRLDNTLVIFTSDHGESFGEYGVGLHGAPVVPETVYVPTVFIHPSLSKDDFTADPQNDIIEHVDVVQTALSAVDKEDMIPTAGTDLLTEKRHRDWGYSHVLIQRGNQVFYEADSIWGFDGGVVFQPNSKVLRIITALNKILKSPDRYLIRDNLLEAVRAFADSNRIHGSPPMPKDKAEEALVNFRNTLSESNGKDIELDDTTKQTLEDLGYIN